VSLWIKICGVTSIEDALAAVELGADALGLNFAPGSPRCLASEQARLIREEIPLTVEVVGVFVDATQDDIRAHAEYIGFDTVQLHGSETPEFLDQVSQIVPAYKAVRVGGPEDVELADRYGGDRILVDAKVAGAMGGTGQTFDWSLIEGLNERRKLILAGGLKPENVASSVKIVFPYGIDTASGVESAPGKKDADRMRAFIRGARDAVGSYQPLPRQAEESEN
jgi:phosphoribosylanthranilate isomerase